MAASYHAVNWKLYSRYVITDFVDVITYVCKEVFFHAVLMQAWLLKFCLSICHMQVSHVLGHRTKEPAVLILHERTIIFLVISHQQWIVLIGSGL